MAASRRAALAAARRAAGHTQETLAAALYVDRTTVIRWEAGDHAPQPYLRPKLARLLGRSQDQLRELIDGPVLDTGPTSSLGYDIEVACEWLDEHADWRPGTAYRRLTSKLAVSEVSRIRAREVHRGAVARSAITTALDAYHADEVPWYRIRYEDIRIQLAIVASRDWLALDFPLTRENDLFSLAHTTPEDPIHLDATAANQAIRRLLEAVVLDVAIVNAPLYRLVDLVVARERIAGSFSIVPFVQYALTTDLLETELVDHLAGHASPARVALPIRDRYLPTVSSVFDVSQRSCCGGVLALCAIARPADPHRGPADYALLTQERGQRVLNGVGRLSVIPRGFHQPLTDFRADAPLGSTLRRELEEELFRRTDVDNTISDGRIADPMHPNRLSEPMRWLMEDPSRIQFESTGFGFNLVNGNFECTCLTVIRDPEFWVRYGDRIEANWESVGLRQYSSRDRLGIRDLIQDEAWSNEGLFALLQGLRRLHQLDSERVDIAHINVGLAD
jgi:transcriptional regulator with XRE-family HTH domain